MIKIDWKEMPNLSKLTLVVPTYNRQRCALQQMHFWSDSPVTLHILDGTSEPIKSEELKDIGDNVHYYHMPCSYEERVGRAVEFVDTPYASFLIDDEFFIPTALEKCIEYLKNNKDFVACIGLCMRLHPSKKGIAGKPFNNVMKGYRCFEATSGERMRAKMNRSGGQVYYAVQRADTWKRSAAIIPKYKFSCPWVQEIQFELAICYQGNSIVIEDLMWLRNTENAPVDVNNWNRKLGFDEWIKDPRYADEVKIFYEITATELAKIDGSDRETVLNEFKLAVDAILNWYKNGGLLFSTAALRNRLMRLAPKKVKTMIDLARVSLTWKPMMKAAELMVKDGVNVDIKQLQEIVEFIKKGKGYESRHQNELKG